jgi:hypothetical protein
VYLDSRFGQVMNGGGTLFWLQDPIVLPSPRYAFNLSVPFVAMPLTHYVITEANRRLHIIYTHVAPPEPLIVDLPLGNHNIDELADVLNGNLLYGFTAAYSESTNTLHFSTATISAALEIGPLTTCSELIGVRAGDTSVLGSYYAPGGVNLAGTTSFYIRSNLRTRNRDPRSLGYSSIIANVPITKSHNGLERYTQAGYSFGLRERSINYIIIEILDDALEPVTFHGGVWQVTLEFTIEEAEAYAGPIDYRALMAQNGSLFGGANVAAGQRADAPSGGPQRDAGADRESNKPPRAGGRRDPGELYSAI